MLAVSTSNIVTGLHVVFAVSFLGAGGALSVIGPAARGKLPVLPFALGVVVKIQRMLLVPGILGVIATGVYLTVANDWDVGGEGWLIASLIVFTLMVAAQFVAIPAAARAKAEAERIMAGDDPPKPTPELQRDAKTMGRLGPWMVIGMATITFLMSAKPF